VDLVRTLPRIDVPVVIVQGRHDQVSPGHAAQRYFNTVEAPSKHLVWFEHSAHTPQLDEPEEFRDLLAAIRSGKLPDAVS
jgi:pimeloyl-ACP methyl ester carboxylesterase